MLSYTDQSYTRYVPLCLVKTESKLFDCLRVLVAVNHDNTYSFVSFPDLLFYCEVKNIYALITLGYFVLQRSPCLDVSARRPLYNQLKMIIINVSDNRQVVFTVILCMEVPPYRYV